MDAAGVEAEVKDEEQPLLRHSREYTLVTEDAEATDGRWISEIRRYAACSPRSSPSLCNELLLLLLLMMMMMMMMMLSCGMLPSLP
jgi:hypothetical protein